MTAPPVPYRHTLMHYAGASDFAGRAETLVRSAVDAGRPVMVAAEKLKIENLRDVLGSEGDRVRWLDVREAGGNPARLISLWREFVSAHPASGGSLGLGEPLLTGRDADALAEAQSHEELLNRALADAAGLTLVCPYDVTAVDEQILRHTASAHPYVAGGSPPEHLDAGEHDPFEGTLPAITLPHVTLGSGEPGFPGGLRQALAELEPDGSGTRDHLHIAVAALLASVTEDVPPPVVVWRDGAALLAEVGPIGDHLDALAGREWPPSEAGLPRGLWMANQLCDLVQVRRSGTQYRIRLRVAS